MEKIELWKAEIHLNPKRLERSVAIEPFDRTEGKLVGTLGTCVSLKRLEPKRSG